MTRQTEPRFSRHHPVVRPASRSSACLMRRENLFFRGKGVRLARYRLLILCEETYH